MWCLILFQTLFMCQKDKKDHTHLYFDATNQNRNRTMPKVRFLPSLTTEYVLIVFLHMRGRHGSDVGGSSIYLRMADLILGHPSPRVKRSLFHYCGEMLHSSGTSSRSEH